MSDNIEKRTETITLETAKSRFPLNQHWVDMSGNSEFPLQPLCVCFDTTKIKEYTSIPLAKHILKGIDGSGNMLKIILCDRCLDYNIKHQENSIPNITEDERVEVKVK